MTSAFRLALNLLTAGLLLSALPDVAMAYGGPGSVISGIGTLLAAVAALLAALFGFVWFPLKRLFQKLRSEDEPHAPASSDPTSE